MPIQIAVAGLDGSLQVNDDGSVTYTKADLSDTKVMPAAHAIRRWPQAEGQIRRTLADLGKAI